MKNKDNRQSAANGVDLSKFKPIPGWEDRYLISEEGVIWSINSGVVRKQNVDKSGYMVVTLYGPNSKAYGYKVHRLVAMTFISNPNNLPQVNHKDFDRINNCIDNLEWVTLQDNIRYSVDAGHYIGGPKFNGSVRVAYTLTNVFNGKTVTILGMRNLLMWLGITRKSFATIYEIVNTGRYATKGILKGIKIDKIDIKVQRSTVTDGVGASAPEMVGISLFRDEDMIQSCVKAQAAQAGLT